MPRTAPSLDAAAALAAELQRSLDARPVLKRIRVPAHTRRLRTAAPLNLRQSRATLNLYRALRTFNALVEQDRSSFATRSSSTQRVFRELLSAISTIHSRLGT